MAAQDPYLAGKIGTGAYAAKVEVHARVVAVLQGVLADRGLELIAQPSRAVNRGEIHEIIITDEAPASGSRVGRVAYERRPEVGRGKGSWTGFQVGFQDGSCRGLNAPWKAPAIPASTG